MENSWTLLFWCVCRCLNLELGGGFQIFVYFHPYLGKWSNFTHIFQMVWLNHQVEKNPPHQRQGRSVTELVWCRWSSFQRWFGCRFQTMTSRGRWLRSSGMQWDCIFKKKMVDTDCIFRKDGRYCEKSDLCFWHHVSMRPLTESEMTLWRSYWQAYPVEQI